MATRFSKEEKEQNTPGIEHEQMANKYHFYDFLCFIFSLYKSHSQCSAN
jgi:hypothetical protein